MAFDVPKIFSKSDGQFCGPFFFVFFLLALFGYGVRMIKYKLKNPTEVNGTMKSYYKVKLLLNIAYYKQCCDEHWGTCVSFNSGFLGVYAQQWDCWVIRQFYFQFLKESPHCSP